MTIPIFHHTFDPTGVSLTYDSGWVILSLVIAAIEQSFVEKYSNEISDAVDRNEDLKQYTIADCQLNNPTSILCGGTSLDEVQADKGNSTVTLVPHIEFDADNTEIETDNPNDEGVNTYFGVQEKEN